MNPVPVTPARPRGSLVESGGLSPIASRISSGQWREGDRLKVDARRDGSGLVYRRAAKSLAATPSGPPREVPAEELNGKALAKPVEKPRPVVAGP